MVRIYKSIPCGFINPWYGFINHDRTGTATGIDPDFANALAAIAGAFSLGQSGQSQSHPPPLSNER